jgi:acetylornithine aminotransferase
MDLKQLDQEYVLHTYARNYVNFTKGCNATLYDDSNKDYIDFTSGIGVVSCGHGNERIANTIYNQSKNMIHISNLFLIEPQAKLAQKIAQLSGYDMAMFFANSGAEANEAAIKIARKYGEVKFDSKRYKVITLEHSFHGRTITTVKATGQKDMHTSHFSPYPDGFSYNAQLEDIYNSIDNETVAVMLELVQGEGGVQPFPKDQIQKLATYLKKNNILLIVDEVQTGAFRTGEFLASNLYEIEPDIITMAKGIGAGIPIGVTMTKHKDILSPGDHGSTFGGNYLSTATALEACDILNELKDSGKLDETMIFFETKLKELYSKYSTIFTQMVGLGLMRGLRVSDSDTQAQIIKNCFDNGVLVLKAGKNTVRFLPPLTISKEEISLGFERLDNALQNL